MAAPADCAVLANAVPAVANLLGENCCISTTVTCGGGRITGLLLHARGLAGPVPDLTALDALTAIDLSNNALTGPIPDFTRFPKLVQLHVEGNNLSGNVSSTLFKIPFFRFANNPQLTGSLDFDFLKVTDCDGSGTQTCGLSVGAANKCGIKTCPGVVVPSTSPAAAPTTSPQPAAGPEHFDVSKGDNSVVFIACMIAIPFIVIALGICVFAILRNRGRVNPSRSAVDKEMAVPVTQVSLAVPPPVAKPDMPTSTTRVAGSAAPRIETIREISDQVAARPPSHGSASGSQTRKSDIAADEDEDVGNHYSIPSISDDEDNAGPSTRR
ncbi:hypothetical protein HK105_206362 [Polyrhizophydium stewartii]|uniref:Uncharacterized protein n=1 Tax=Polyrhizophydium stewartii TaxID=2732419 RepID=A0ABR4N3N1_9FUNG